MNKIFQNLMNEATRLTRDGNLHAAMAAIRQALGGDAATADDRGGSQPSGSTPDAGRTSKPRADTKASGTGAADLSGLFSRRGDVIDLDLREIRDPADARPGSGADAGDQPPESPSPSPGAGRAARPPQAPQPAGRLRSTFQRGSMSRDYELYVPPPSATADGRARPLIVMLHGCTQSSPDFARGTDMDALAAESGFLVLYPEQSMRHNPQRCWNWFKQNHQRRDAGEPGLLAALTRAVIAEYGVDPSRVYVAGLSAGGAMAAILASSYPDLFAAVGVHSGLANGMASDLPAALATMKSGPGRQRGAPMPPTIVFHGDADQTVHPDHADALFDACCGGKPWTSSTSTRDARADGGASPGRPGARASVTVCADVTGHVKAERWIVRGAGHAWSGGSPKGSFTHPGGPSASREMVRFFLTHARTTG